MMAMKHPQNELHVYEAVKTGELEIDGKGRIWRVKKRTADRWTGGVKTTPCKRVRAEMSNGSGYLQVRVMRNGKRFYAAAHRLVWLHFNGPIPQGKTINHKNKSGDKGNNRPKNLEPATYSEQRLHAIRVLGAKHWNCEGQNHPKTKLKDADVMEMRRLRRRGFMVKDIAAKFGMNKKAVSFITTGRTWKHLPFG